MSRDCTDTVEILHTDGQSLLTLRYPIQMSLYADPKIFTEFTEPERGYAISQVDPFHDYPYQVTGAPSDYDSPSVLLTMNQEMTLTADKFGLPVTEGSKWDFHVTILPLLQKAAFYSARLSQPCKLITGGSSDESPFCNLFPITVHASDNGGKTYVYDTGYPLPIGPESNIVGFFSNPSSTIQIPRIIRVAAISFEVVDETPKYYQQGSVTCYMSPGYSQRSSMGYTATPSGSTSNTNRCHTNYITVGPPNTLAQATIIPNSRTWKAHEGAYVVGRRFDESNPFTRPTISDITLYNPNDPDNPLLKNSFFSREAFNAYFAPSTDTHYDSFNSPIPYQVSGAYFVGVSGQFGTFRLRTKITYEIIPDPLDTTLMPLARPPLKRNFDFEYRLSRLLASLDNFCPQSMNPKGEWWKSAIRTYREVTSAADKALSSDIAKAIASKIPGGQDLLAAGQAITKSNAEAAKLVAKVSKVYKKEKKKDAKNAPKPKPK